MDNTAVAQMKAGVSELMNGNGLRALIWSEAMFTATGLPLVSDANGATCTVHGLAMTAEGLAAITSLPAGKPENQGVTAIYANDNLPADMAATTEGTAAQWSVLCDCFERAMQQLKAQGIENAPRPWW